jgi:hypothetical protein
MSSFRKIGGIRKQPHFSKFANQPPHTPSHEMHISQVQCEQTVFFPLMSDNETPKYYEDSGISYCFNNSVQDFALNLDNLSATTIFNVDSLIFADGTTLTSAPLTTEQKQYNAFYEIFPHHEPTIQFTNNLDYICLPDIGIYLISFCVSVLPTSVSVNTDKLPNSFLSILLPKNIDEYNSNSQLHFPIIHQVCSGTITIHYLDADCEIQSKNQMKTPYLRFKLTNGIIQPHLTNHITITKLG